MQDGCRIFGNGKSSKTTNKNQHHKFPSGLGYPKPEGRDEGESYTLFRTLPPFTRFSGQPMNDSRKGGLLFQKNPQRLLMGIADREIVAF